MPLRLRKAAETSSAQRTVVFVSATEDVIVSFLAAVLFLGDVAKTDAVLMS